MGLTTRNYINHRMLATLLERVWMPISALDAQRPTDDPGESSIVFVDKRIRPTGLARTLSCQAYNPVPLQRLHYILRQHAVTSDAHRSTCKAKSHEWRRHDDDGNEHGTTLNESEPDTTIAVYAPPPPQRTYVDVTANPQLAT